MANIPLRRGMWIRHENHVYVVVDFNERHTGKQRPTVHVSLADVRDGRPVDRTLDDLLPITEVEHAYRPMQFLYASGDDMVFMDSETFEEYTLSRPQLGGREAFLSEGSEYRVTFLEGKPMRVEMDDIVVLKVANTAPPGHSVGSAANITKEATLENGLEIRVPLFIKTGDAIKVDTRDKSYAGKDHGS
ncbi:MAG: elongation factor P [Phycisphaerae bacterium]|nr:MAG: elongation factor P [Planctomycetia bacterium]RIK70324.1 MAG: elongation factor P [Planctomycetota bacterium]GJQ26987.1 MAG: elongation factor P [Phycisphaerae bacterium]